MNSTSKTAGNAHPPGKIVYEFDETTGIARLVISNVSRYNAMSLSMWESLHKHVKDAEGSPDVRVLVLIGDGEKAFISGADISEFAHLRNSPEQVKRYAEAVDTAQQSLANSSKPVIAAIRGVCMGGGIGLALASDLRYCSASSKFRMPAAKMGLGYDRHGLARAVAVLGAARATDIFFTARTFDGKEAARIGMVHDAFDDDRFDDEIQAIASAIAGNAPLTLRAAKLAIRLAIGDPGITDVSDVDRAVQACFDSTDYQEGQAAFREKRAPRFTGR